MVKPMLDDVELQHVQKIETDEDQVLAQHGVPALEGDFLQGLDRRATRVTLCGVSTGPEAGEGLKALRDKFRSAEPVPFVADITTATRLDQVLIEEMGVRELAGKPERFEYALTLREFIAPPRVAAEPPSEIEIPESPVEDIEQGVGTLIVEVNVEGQPGFDFSRVTVTVRGTQEDGTDLPRTLTNRTDNIWTEEDFPAGQFTVEAAVVEPEGMSGSASAVVQAGETTRATITLRPGAVIAKAFVIHFRFDSAFIEPCMRPVLRQAAEYAQDHPDEKLVIVGHTDLVGSDEYNQSLSERRARSTFAYLTLGRDRDAALAEWNILRQDRPTGELPSIKDTWATGEYQHILQDLGYYGGNVDGNHGPITDSAVRAFQQDKGVTADGVVGDQTWSALIEAYLSQDNLAVPEGQFLPNCPGEVLRWLGCGEQAPVKNTQDAWRPNRRAELLFVKADALPCEVPKADTFDLPSPGVVGSNWCLGPGDPNKRCCFITRDPEVEGRWLVRPVDPRTITVRGSIKLDNGTPAANVKYVLIAPDGEFMDGERPRGPNRGRPVPGRTTADGTFEYPDKPKGVGVYTLEVELEPPLVARLAGEPPAAAKGTVVCKRLDGTSDFDVIVGPPGARPTSLAFVEADNVENLVESVAVGGTVRVRADVPGAVGDEITVEVSSHPTGVTPPGPAPAPASLEFVDPDDVENVVEKVAVGGRLRVRADVPGVAGDEITVELSSHPTGVTPPAPGPAPGATSLEFVDPDNVENVIENVGVGGRLRIRADVPDVVGDEITVEVSSQPTES